VQKKKAKPKSQGTGAKSDKSDTTKKAKVPGEELVTYAMKKAWMGSQPHQKRLYERLEAYQGGEEEGG